MKILQKILRVIPFLTYVFIIVNNYSDGISKDYPYMQFFITCFWIVLFSFLRALIIEMFKKQK